MVMFLFPGVAASLIGGGVGRSHKRQIFSMLASSGRLQQ
jgi:hypothetical protein